ncbi:hypothetical protein [Bacillus sp. AFS017336]|uniref:hypothetical protein n=1 Tax=Bacillus sp. AFS017336 TaxID=2033489 RepID=UPI0015CF6C99|nr:hypothetical protein [Bacillus sp. AFS017336]
MEKNNTTIVSLVISLVVMLLVTILNYEDHRFIYGTVGALISVSILWELKANFKRLKE